MGACDFFQSPPWRLFHEAIPGDQLAAWPQSCQRGIRGRLPELKAIIPGSAVVGGWIAASRKGHFRRFAVTPATSQAISCAERLIFVPSRWCRSSKSRDQGAEA